MTSLKAIYDRILIEDTIKKLSTDLDIPRHEMPQIAEKDVPDYVAYLKSKGIEVKKMTFPVDTLKPTQSHVNLDKVHTMMTADDSESILAKPYIISGDKYIMDGHHRAITAYNKQPDYKCNAIYINLPIKELLTVSHDFPKVTYKPIE